ncbi:MAG TPA: Uma2 family endonuclease [Isosphaeraceae bacterium]|nr:Uma2 family endonuclease [Isosphaeraceae bacterium]
MAAASETKPEQAQASEWPDYDQVVTLEGVDWSAYERISAMKGDRAVPRLIYNQGSLTLVSPSQEHERPEDRLDRLVMEICIGLRITCMPVGKTRFRQESLGRGVEGDRAYYIAREPLVRHIKKIDIEVDPPPDLVIEVELTHPAENAIEAWCHFGVPELWYHNESRKTFAILHLNDAGQYVESPISQAFPFLNAFEILSWIQEEEDEPESEWAGRLREWVHDVLAARQTHHRAMEE